VAINQDLLADCQEYKDIINTICDSDLNNNMPPQRTMEMLIHRVCKAITIRSADQERGKRNRGCRCWALYAHMDLRKP
jgi:hypothetical protein